MADPYFGRTSPAQCDDTAEALRRLYPGNQASNDTIGPIEPDILGEAALARLVEDRRANGEALIAATLEDDSLSRTATNGSEGFATRCKSSDAHATIRKSARARQ